MGCMNATGYVSGQIEPFSQANKSNFEAFLIEQLTLLGFQESQLVVSKNIEIKYIPYLRELQTTIDSDIHSHFDDNVYLVPILTNQLRELYIKIAQNFIRYWDYKLNNLINKIGLKYQSLIRIGDQFPKQLSLRWYNNQIRKIQIDPNFTILLVCVTDIGYELLQFIKQIKGTYLLVFRVKEGDTTSIQLFVEANHFQNCSIIIGIDDTEERYHAIMNICIKVNKKLKKNSNSDSHSRILTQFINQEDQENSWDDGAIIFNVLNQSQLDLSTLIISIQNHKIISIHQFRAPDLLQQPKQSIPQSIDQGIYKSLKQIMIKELIQALQLKSSQFKQYFKLRLSTQKVYKDLKLQNKYYLPVQLKVQNSNDIDPKTQEILTIIQKASHDTLQVQQSRKFQLPTKTLILQLLQQVASQEELLFSYNSVLHIQYSYGDDIIDSQFTSRKTSTQSKYKWKMIKYYNDFKLISHVLPKRQLIYGTAQQLQRSINRNSEILNQIISNMKNDRWQVGEEYYPINDVYQVSFINSIDETSQKLDKIVVNAENSYLIIFLMNYQDPQNINQLDQIISFPLQTDNRLVVLSDCSFDNDNFDELINKKKIEKRIHGKNIQFWFPIQDKINDLTFSQYLDLFYNLNSKENVIIINSKGILCHRLTGFHLITMFQDRNLQEDDRKIPKPLPKHQHNYDQIKKMKQELKQTIEKEIKQQQQFSLHHEQDNNTTMKLDFKWPKEIIVKINNTKSQLVSQKYLKPTFINTSGMQMEQFSQIISNKQYDFL